MIKTEILNLGMKLYFSDRKSEFFKRPGVRKLNFMTPKLIGEKMQTHAIRINKSLEMNGFIRKNTENQWVPTDEGANYCIVLIYEGRTISMRWDSCILDTRKLVKEETKIKHVNFLQLFNEEIIEE